jgi:hypothetical protein
VIKFNKVVDDGVNLTIYKQVIPEKSKDGLIPFHIYMKYFESKKVLSITNTGFIHIFSLKPISHETNPNAPFTFQTLSQKKLPKHIIEGAFNPIDIDTST